MHRVHVDCLAHSWVSRNGVENCVYNGDENGVENGVDNGVENGVENCVENGVDKLLGVIPYH